MKRISVKQFCCVLFMAFAHPIAFFAQETGTSYTIDARLNIENKTIAVAQNIQFLFPNSDDKHIVYFFDWSNAYKDATTPLSNQLAEEFDRSFYLSGKNKKGYTDIKGISKDSTPLVWQRLPDQPDVIKVFLPELHEKKDTISLDFEYHIKIPDHRFTGFGIHNGNEIKLRDWFIALAPRIDRKWLLHSQLNLEDNSHLAADFDIQWTFPASYTLVSNLSKTIFEKNNGQATVRFKGNHQTRAQFIFSKTDKFIAYATKNGGLIHTDMVSSTKVTKEIDTSINRIVEFVSSYLHEYPHQKQLLLKLDLDKNPFYGFNQLPAFLNIFTDRFYFEIQFLKVYLNNFLHETLPIDKRANHWLIGGLQTYLLMKYVETFYPDQKFIGELAKFKLLKSFHFTDMPFNSGYLFFYETSLRANLHQEDVMSKEKLTKFNRKIGIPYHVGIGLRYLENHIGETEFKSAIRQYMEPMGEHNFEQSLRLHTEESLDWFFNDYIKEREPFDFYFKKISRANNQSTYTVKEKKGRKVPIEIAFVKNDSIVSKKVIQSENKSEKWMVSGTDADFMAINPTYTLPEWNSKNNWMYLKNRAHLKPLKLNIFKDLENPKTVQLFTTPIANFNYYDGISPGLRVRNKKFKTQPFQYDIQPQYGLKSESLVGHFRMSYRQYRENKSNYLTLYSLFGSSYHYDNDLRYSVFVPSLSLYYRTPDLRSNERQMLNFSWFNVQRQRQNGVETTPNYRIWNVSHLFSNKRAIKHFTAETNFEASNTFGKIFSSVEYRKLFPSGRQLGLRAFAGKFLWHNATQNTFFDFNLNRPNDYLFRYNFLGRSETTGFFSQQFITAEGGFKSQFDKATANDYLASLNLFAGLWKWVEIYGDIGLAKNIDAPVRGYFDSGLRINLVPDYFELYLPMVSSNGWEITQSNYVSTLRFVISFRYSELAKLFTRNWF